MLIGPPIPEMQLFKKLTLKIQGQGHGWGQSSKSQGESNILSTHIPLVPCQSALPFLRYSIFKIWPWKSKVKVIAQGHKVGITPYQLIFLSLHADWPCYSWDTAISKFDIENSRLRSWVRSKLKVATWVQHSVDSHHFHSILIGHPIPELWLFQNLTLKVKGQGHGWGHTLKSNVGLTSYRLTSLSFHVNRPSHSWDTAFSKFDLENHESRSWVTSQFKVTMWV